MIYDSTGFLQINAFSAEGAIPTQKINIRVYGNEEGNGGIDYSVLTDRDGKSITLSLPAPSKEYSLEPNSPESAFSTYNVEAFGEGFYPKKLFDVAIFSGVKSILPLEMIPDGGITEYVTAPMSNNISIIDENEDLQ